MGRKNKKLKDVELSIENGQVVIAENEERQVPAKEVFDRKSRQRPKVIIRSSHR